MVVATFHLKFNAFQKVYNKEFISPPPVDMVVSRLIFYFSSERLKELTNWSSDFRLGKQTEQGAVAAEVLFSGRMTDFCHPRMTIATCRAKWFDHHC